MRALCKIVGLLVATVLLANSSDSARSFAAGPAVVPKIYPEGPDRDETPEGRAEAASLLRKVGDKKVEFNRILPKYTPLAAKRAGLASKLNDALAYRQQCQHQLEALASDRASCATEIDNALFVNNREGAADLQGVLRSLDASISQTRREDGRAAGRCTMLQQSLREVATEIAPYELQLKQIWAEMMEIRVQWLAARDLFKKYARADLELAAKVVDEWEQMDGLWPAVHCLAALIAVKQGDMETAHQKAAMAEATWEQFAGSELAVWPLLDAVQGLVLVQGKQSRQKGFNKLDDAYRRANKIADSDRPEDAWLLYLIIGEAYSATVTKQKQALAAFDRAIVMGAPEYMVSLSRCVVLLEGRKDLRDPRAARDSLIPIWKQTGERSWRIAFAMTIAHDALGENAVAETYWKKVEHGAPERLLTELSKRRADSALESASLATDADEELAAATGDSATDRSSDEPPRKKSRKQRARERAAPRP